MRGAARARRAAAAALIWMTTNLTVTKAVLLPAELYLLLYLFGVQPLDNRQHRLEPTTTTVAGTVYYYRVWRRHTD